MDNLPSHPTTTARFQTKPRFSAALLVAIQLLFGTVAFSQDQPTTNVKPYETVPGVSGELHGAGSDTLKVVVNQWMKAFMGLYPEVKATYQAKGSAAAGPALVEGTAQLGVTSRKLTLEEEFGFQKEYGASPIAMNVALDCVAVFVHEDNPVKGLSLAQLDCIFSKTRNSGYASLESWDRVGVRDDAWKTRSIVPYGRDSKSGTRALLRDTVLFRGEFKDTVKEQPDSAAVVNRVAEDPGGIGYGSIALNTKGVRAIPLSRTHAQPLQSPSVANALKGTYPLGRRLMLQVVDTPSEPLPLQVREFIKFVFSEQGQKITADSGFTPILPSQVNPGLGRLLK